MGGESLGWRGWFLSGDRPQPASAVEPSRLGIQAGHECTSGIRWCPGSAARRPQPQAGSGVGPPHSGLVATPCPARAVAVRCNDHRTLPGALPCPSAPGPNRTTGSAGRVRSEAGGQTLPRRQQVEEYAGVHRLDEVAFEPDLLAALAIRVGAVGRDRDEANLRPSPGADAERWRPRSRPGPGSPRSHSTTSGGHSRARRTPSGPVSATRTS